MCLWPSAAAAPPRPQQPAAWRSWRTCERPIASCQTPPGEIQTFSYLFLPVSCFVLPPSYFFLLSQTLFFILSPSTFFFVHSHTFSCLFIFCVLLFLNKNKYFPTFSYMFHTFSYFFFHTFSYVFMLFPTCSYFFVLFHTSARGITRLSRNGEIRSRNSEILEKGP